MAYEQLLEGNFWRAIVEVLVGAMGPLGVAVPLLVVAGGMWIYTQSLSMLTVLLILLGGTTMPLLPPTAQTGAGAVLAIGVGLALYQMFWRGNSR